VYGEGIDRISEIIYHGVNFGIIEQKGSWFSYDGTQLGQGKIKTREVLLDNPELLEQIENLIYKMIEE